MKWQVVTKIWRKTLVCKPYMEFHADLWTKYEWRTWIFCCNCFTQFHV